MNLFQSNRVYRTLIILLLLGFHSLPSFAQDHVLLIDDEPIRPMSALKIDPSHLIFDFAHGLMVGYEARFNENLNWSLELGKSIKSIGSWWRDFESGTKLKAGFRKYMLHVGKKKNRTRFIGVGLFYDDHTMSEFGRPVGDPTFSVELYKTRRSSIGLEIINGFVVPLGSKLILETYGVLRSSLRFRDHLDAPDIYHKPEGYFQGTRKEGTKWRTFHAMVGLKLSFVLN